MNIKQSASICATCPPCGTTCSHFDNKIKFVFSKKEKKIVKLKFDTSYSVCQGECEKECMTSVKLVENL